VTIAINLPHYERPPTFKWRKATIQDEFQVAKLSFREDDRGELLRFIVELLAARRIARNEVFEDPTCVPTSQSWSVLSIVGKMGHSIP
jgi:hypothetical protein